MIRNLTVAVLVGCSADVAEHPVQLYLVVEDAPVADAYVFVHDPSGAPIDATFTDQAGYAAPFVPAGGILTVAAVVDSPAFDGVPVLAAVSVFGVQPGETLRIGGVSRPPPSPVGQLRATIGMPPPHPRGVYYQYDFGCGIEGVFTEVKGVLPPLDVTIPEACLGPDDQVVGRLQALGVNRNVLDSTHVWGTDPTFRSWDVPSQQASLAWVAPRPWWVGEIVAGPRQPGGWALHVVATFDDRSTELTADIDLGPAGFAKQMLVQWTEQNRLDEYGPRAYFRTSTEEHVALSEEQLPPGVSATYDPKGRAYDVRLLGARRDGVQLYASSVWLAEGITWSLVGPAQVGPWSVPQLEPAFAEAIGLDGLGTPDLQIIEAFADADHPTTAELRQARAGRWSGFEPPPSEFPQDESFERAWSRFVLAAPASTLAR